MTSKTANFLKEISTRRTIYQLSKTPKILDDKDILALVRQTVKNSPSSFNSQSARAVVILGDEHDKFWGETVPAVLKEHIKDEESLKRNLGRLDGFKAAAGSVLFFESQNIVEGFQKNIPAYAHLFPEWSQHGSAMAQIHTWTALELEGYGANLQHYNGAGDAFLKEHDLPSDYKLIAQVVFGAPQGPPGDKEFLPEDERVKSFGAQA
ncbi:type II nitroreductase [Tilletia horrida]|uniref:Type II nitroreductase n=1 Tax=Tilletia horrida TaxID=155126 RepID=A0AAN6GRP6_9BASI|nr:type II nitroreductase [Tilletia horrida]KAK0568103.1 type II nitroreductase [Tilletia horrida]